MFTFLFSAVQEDASHKFSRLQEESKKAQANFERAEAQERLRNYSGDYPPAVQDKLNIIYGKTGDKPPAIIKEVKGNQIECFSYPKDFEKKPIGETPNKYFIKEGQVVKGSEITRNIPPHVSFDYVVYLPPDLTKLKAFMFEVYGGSVYQSYHSAKSRYRWLAHKGIGVVQICLSDLEVPFVGQHPNLLLHQAQYTTAQIDTILEDIHNFRAQFPHILEQSLPQFKLSEEKIAEIKGLRVFLYGTSFGGYITLLYASSGDKKGDFDGYIPVAPGMGIRNPNHPKITKDRFASITKLTLIIQGQSDARVRPHTLASEFEAFLEDNPSQTTIRLEAPEGGHDPCSGWLSFENQEDSSNTSPETQEKRIKLDTAKNRCQAYLVHKIETFIESAIKGQPFTGLNLSINNLRLQKLKSTYEANPISTMHDSIQKDFLLHMEEDKEHIPELMMEVEDALHNWDSFRLALLVQFYLCRNNITKNRSFLRLDLMEIKKIMDLMKWEQIIYGEDKVFTKDTDINQLDHNKAISILTAIYPSPTLLLIKTYTMFENFIKKYPTLYLNGKMIVDTKIKPALEEFKKRHKSVLSLPAARRSVWRQAATASVKQAKDKGEFFNPSEIADYDEKTHLYSHDLDPMGIDYDNALDAFWTPERACEFLLHMICHSTAAPMTDEQTSILQELKAQFTHDEFKSLWIKYNSMANNLKFRDAQVAILADTNKDLQSRIAEVVENLKSGLPPPSDEDFKNAIRKFKKWPLIIFGILKGTRSIDGRFFEPQKALIFEPDLPANVLPSGLSVSSRRACMYFMLAYMQNPEETFAKIGRLRQEEIQDFSQQLVNLLKPMVEEDLARPSKERVAHIFEEHEIKNPSLSEVIDQRISDKQEHKLASVESVDVHP